MSLAFAQVHHRSGETDPVWDKANSYQNQLRPENKELFLKA